MGDLLELSPEEKDAGLALMQQELTNQGNQMQMVAESKVAGTNLRTNAQAMDYAVKSSTTLGNKSPAYEDAVAWASQEPLEHTPGTPMITMENVYSDVIARIPKGDTLLKTFGNVSTAREAATGMMVVRDNAPPARVGGGGGVPPDTSGMQYVGRIPPQNDREVAARIYEQTSGPQNVTAVGFDLDKTLRNIQTLYGEEKGMATIQAITTIDTTMANRQSLIRKQAEIEAGVAEADAAVKKLSQAAIARGWQPSSTIEVVNAQAVQQQALAASQVRATNMISQDAELIRLKGARDTMGVFLQKSFAQGEREQATAELVTEEEVMNSKILIGETGNGMQDRLNVAQRRSKDKNYAMLIGYNAETQTALLTHIDPSIRAQALKILIERDKKLPGNKYDPLTGRGIDPNATKTPVSMIVEKAMSTPTEVLIEKYYKGETGEESQTTLGKYKRAQGSEKAKMELNIKANLLPKIVEDAVQTSYRDSSKWLGTNVMPDQPLGKVIANIKSTSPGGVVPMGTVIDTFVTDQTITGPDGKPLSFEARLNMLHSAVTDTSTAERQSMLLIDPIAITNRVKEEIKNRAIRARISVPVEDINAIIRSRLPTSPYETGFR